MLLCSAEDECRRSRGAYLIMAGVLVDALLGDSFEITGLPRQKTFDLSIASVRAKAINALFVILRETKNEAAVNELREAEEKLENEERKLRQENRRESLGEIDVRVGVDLKNSKSAL